MSCSKFVLSNFTFHSWTYYCFLHPTGVCFVVAVGLTQDLKLILSTKKHPTKQNKENKTQARIHLLQQKVEKEKDSLWRMYAVCYCQQQHPWKCHAMVKIRCAHVLLPASLWRRYSRVLFSSSAVYFYQCVYQIECLRCQVPSREGLYEWDMLPILLLFASLLGLLAKIKV